MKPTWLAPALDYIGAHLAYQMRVSEQPGVSLAVAYKGEVVLALALGHADLASGEALTPEHRFRVASHSKTFTAAAILKLREQGRLKLDDTAGQYVSGLHPDVATATITQLLSHTAGLFRDGTDSYYWAERGEFLDEAEIRRDLALPPAIDPNTRLKYSNHGFALAGLVIEAITGERYNDFVQREIVLPSGLGATTPDVPMAEGARLARGHSLSIPLGRRVVFRTSQSTHALAAATGFVSTPSDLVRFYSSLAPGAATSVLSAASRRELTRPQWPDAYSVLDRRYGLGTMHGTLDGWTWFSHTGGFPGVTSRTVMVPAEEIAVSCATNSADGSSGLWVDSALHILQRFKAEGAAEAAGDWRGRWWGNFGAADLVPMGRKVLVAAPAQINPFLKVPELEVSGDAGVIKLAGAFASHGEPVSLVRGADGAVSAVRMASGTVYPEAVFAAELENRYK